MSVGRTGMPEKGILAEQQCSEETNVSIAEESIVPSSLQYVLDAADGGRGVQDAGKVTQLVGQSSPTLCSLVVSFPVPR